MKYSLVINVKGQDSKDLKIYLSDSKSILEPTNSWMNFHLVQSIYFDCNVSDIVPYISFECIGLQIESCAEPDLSSGIVVFIPQAIAIGEQFKIPLNDEIAILKGCEKTEDKKYGIPIGGIAKFLFDAAVNQKTIVELHYSKFHKKFFTEYDLPEWVSVIEDY